MEGILLSLAVLACPVGMGVMMWFMAKGMGRDRTPGRRSVTLDDLRREHARLGADIARAEADGSDRPVELTQTTR